MPDPEVPAQPKEFDAAALVAELEGNDDPETPAEEVVEAAPTNELEPEATPAAPAEEDDDEKFAATFGGKPIPQQAFLQRLAREKKKRQELEAKYTTTQSEYEAIKKSQPMTAQDVERFRQLEALVGNIDKANAELPWANDMLRALAQGKKPDWEAVSAGMQAYLASVPKGDPILYQQQQEMRLQLEELQNERVYNSALSHIQQEDVEIAKILGDKSDPASAPWWAILNEQAKDAFEARNPKSFKEGPNRVQMAKRLVAAAEAFAQKKLKAQLPSANRPVAKLATGNGNAGGAPASKDKAPADIHSKEWAEWFEKGL